MVCGDMGVKDDATGRDRGYVDPREGPLVGCGARLPRAMLLASPACLVYFPQACGICPGGFLARCGSGRGQKGECSFSQGEVWQQCPGWLALEPAARGHHRQSSGGSLQHR